MSAFTVGVVGFVIMLVLIMLRMPLGLALGVVGALGTWILLGTDTVVFVLGSAPVAALSNYTLTVLPLFLLMGSLAVKVGLSEGLYRAAHGFVGHRRGGLAKASIVACAGFGAVCGSSIATVATMSRIAVPEMLRYGYAPKLAAGSVAAGGTLGILIPPSIPLIIYGYLTETSIGQLFAAGIIPGLIATLLYMTAISIWLRFRPHLAPLGSRIPWATRLRLLKGVIGVLLLFAGVMGGIFAGLFSPTEGAAVGAAGALLIGVVQRRISWRAFGTSVMETVIMTSMILFIVLGISIFEFFMTAAKVPAAISGAIEGVKLAPAAVMVGIMIFLVLLGCVLESIAIVFIMTPVLFPIVTKMGYDPVWFGIIIIMVIEFGVITPPIGMNVFVLVKSIPEINMWQAFQGVGPFILSDIVRVTLFFLFPGLVLFLPRLFYG